MGRGRGRGKKQSIVGSLDDNGSGEDEKLPARRRGRPTKPLIEEEDEIVKIEDDDDDDDGGGGDVGVEEMKISKTAENGRKRKRASQLKKNAGSLKDENALGTKTNGADMIKPVGYRQKGSRRKNKPRRAAEVGVECR